jgi:phosphohistidine swiveling domain-containing protein
LSADFSALDRAEFLCRYGHLRPGTYDILSPRYDEDPERYFCWERERGSGQARSGEGRFALSLEQLRCGRDLLEEHGIELDVIDLFEFIKAAIEGREYSKFVFTRSLSEMLSTIAVLGEEHGLSREDCAYADVQALASVYSSSADVGEVLRRSIDLGRSRYAFTERTSLPQLITEPDEVWAFHVSSSQPNFVTRKAVTAQVTVDVSQRTGLSQRIVLIASADPGYDWIFNEDIAGFVTQFGGANSHMAIRAAELGIPAVIGAGERMFRQLSKASHVHLDCANRLVRVLG